jgi:hypothetical protein
MQKTLTSQMLAVVRKHKNLLQDHAEDFLLCDMDILRACPKESEKEFLWVVRKWGTYLLRLDQAGINGNDDNLVRQTSTNNPDAVWFLIHKDVPPAWYGPDYPLGTVKEISAERAVEVMLAAMRQPKKVGA